jgi:hypothetical protein
MSDSHSIESIWKMFEDAGCKQLTRYVNRKTRIRYICSCGNISETTIDAFKTGGRCRECLPKRIENAMRASFYVEKN